jgi:hypothetical protein
MKVRLLNSCPAPRAERRAAKRSSTNPSPGLPKVTAPKNLPLILKHLQKSEKNFGWHFRRFASSDNVTDFRNPLMTSPLPPNDFPQISPRIYGGNAI